MGTTTASHGALQRINGPCVTTYPILRTWSTHRIRNMGMRQSINAPCAFICPHLLACKIITTSKIQTSNIHQRHLTACHPELCYTNLKVQMLLRIITLNSLYPRQNVLSPHPSSPIYCRLKQGGGRKHQTHRAWCLKGTTAHRSS